MLISLPMSLHNYLFSLGLAFALGCDAFAVGLAVGTKEPDSRSCFRLWFHFGLFQFLMPIIGWEIGATILKYIASIEHWVAFTLMFIIASKMLYDSLNSEENDEMEKNPTKGWSLISLAVATSMDALGVGFGMGIAKMQLFIPAIIIGITASIMTYVGLLLGKKMSEKFGKRVESMGAMILYIIAFKLLYF